MSDIDVPKPKFCKVCLDEEVDRPMIRVPASSYCRVHLRAYNKAYRTKKKLEAELMADKYNEYGEPIDEFGMTADERTAYIAREEARLLETYGPPPTD